MKAFVIKNKVHGYFGVNNMYQYPEWSSIDLAYYFKTEKEAEKFKNKNYPTCKVVEITIAEGNLEEENRALKRALELACERIKNMYEQEQQYCTNEFENFVKVEYDFFIEQAKGEKDE